MSAQLLVVRRAGALYGVPSETVALVERRGGGVALRFAAGGELVADGVVGLARDVAVRALPGAVRRRLPAEIAGLALWRTEPVAVLGTAKGRPA